jgi:hypothetical protein
VRYRLRETLRVKGAHQLNELLGELDGRHLSDLHRDTYGCGGSSADIPIP